MVEMKNCTPSLCCTRPTTATLDHEKLVATATTTYPHHNSGTVSPPTDQDYTVGIDLLIELEKYALLSDDDESDDDESSCMDSSCSSFHTSDYSSSTESSTDDSLTSSQSSNSENDDDDEDTTAFDEDFNNIMVDFEDHYYSQMKMKRVRFRTVTIREYAVTVGAEAAVEACPLQLSWDHTADCVLDIREYTRQRKQQQKQKQQYQYQQYQQYHQTTGLVPPTSSCRRLSLQERRKRVCRVLNLSLSEVQLMETEYTLRKIRETFEKAVECENSRRRIVVATTTTAAASTTSSKTETAKVATSTAKTA